MKGVIFTFLVLVGIIACGYAAPAVDKQRKTPVKRRALVSRRALRSFHSHFGSHISSHFGSHISSHIGSHISSHIGSHIGHHVGTHVGLVINHGSSHHLPIHTGLTHHVASHIGLIHHNPTYVGSISNNYLQHNVPNVGNKDLSNLLNSENSTNILNHTEFQNFLTNTIDLTDCDLAQYNSCTGGTSLSISSDKSTLCSTLRTCSRYCMDATARFNFNGESWQTYCAGSAGSIKASLVSMLMLFLCYFLH